MARFTFGATLADYVVQPSDGLWGVGSGAQVTFWTLPDGGTQYTDLIDSTGAAATFITADEYGFIPSFQGPDGVTGMWVDSGRPTRAWIAARDAGGGGEGAYTSIQRIVASSTAPADIRAAATWVCDGIADQEEIQAALDDARDNGGGEVLLTVGDYNLTAPIRIEGTDDVDVEIGIILRGQGARATMLRAGAGLTSVIHLSKVVRVYLSDVGMTIGGTTDGITSSTTNGALSGHRSFWNSEFRNIQINGPWDGSHSGWAINMGSPFRSVFENIEVGGTGNGVRMYSEHADFNPGDLTFERCFVDLIGDGGTAYLIESTTAAGVMNQCEFEMVEAIASGVGCTGIRIAGVGGWGTSHTHWRGVNLEEFDTILDVDYGSANTFRFNHVNLRDGIAGLTAFRFGANSFANSVLSTGLLYVTAACKLYADGNTMDANVPNRVLDTRVYTAVPAAVTATANPAGTTVVQGLTAAGTGTVDVANAQPGPGFTPADHGLITWTDPPSSITGAGYSLAAGQVYLSKVKVTGRATRVSNLWVYVTTAGTALTAGQNHIGLYDASGTLLVSADATAALGSTGAKTIAIAPQTLPIGSYYVAVLANGTGTQPSIAGGAGNTGVTNVGLTTAASRFLNTGPGNTALPASLSLGAQSQNIASRWAALS